MAPAKRLPNGAFSAHALGANRVDAVLAGGPSARGPRISDREMCMGGWLPDGGRPPDFLVRDPSADALFRRDALVRAG
jgi:hypothetical protein